MSDEEIVLKRLKETLDVLKGKNVIGRIDFQIRDMVEDFIRVIEKQSKEIEELNKENTRQHELIGNIHQKWKDKIKAKIEEYKKQQKEEPDAYLCIKVLQSLLEKE